jgi:uncharacterized protein (DUF2252 family)
MCVRSYRKRMGAFASMTVLERWSQRIDVRDLVAQMSRRWQTRSDRQSARRSSRQVMDDDLPQLVVHNGKPRLKDNPPLIFRRDSRRPDRQSRLLSAAFKRYHEALTDDPRGLIDRYQVTDIATKVVGIGSVGRRCGIVLLVADDSDTLCLQIREAGASVLEAHLGRSGYANHGQRVVAGQRLMQAASDVFLGWIADRGRRYYVRQVREIRIKPEVEILNADDLTRYAEWCGWALARAHAKAGDASMISGYLGSGSRFDSSIASFAWAYAEQNDADHAELLKAIRAGRIAVKRE